MKIYYIEFQLGCTLVRKRSPISAKMWAERYYGTIHGPYLVREASEKDVLSVESMGGYIH